jgi:predicted acyl esterase
MRLRRTSRTVLSVALVVTTLTWGGATAASARSASAPAVGGATIAGQAPEPQVVKELRLTMSDGVELQAGLGGRGPTVGGAPPPRPVIVEFSPYAPGCCTEVAGPAYNYLQVHIRGTGSSNGRFDALGPRTQHDVAEVLDWACRQSWSNGRLGLIGFSASAITVYNSLHLDLPCVEAAVLGSGTHELYRDLLYPGGVANGVPALGVFGLIGAPLVQALPDRLGRDPLSLAPVALGMGQIPIDYQLHPTLDDFWRERGFRGDVNHLPILMVDGFFDVESRGAFQAFQALRHDGAHLLVVGAHDGVPVGSGGSDRQRAAWFDRYLRDADNGIDREPAVQLFMAHGDREDMLAGRFVTTSGTDWPLPGTTWASLALDARRSGSATSLNDGSLVLGRAGDATQTYPAVPSLPTATDPYNTAILGINSTSLLTDMTLAEPLGLSYTTAPLATAVRAAGPASVELVLSSTAPETDLYAVLSDVWPDGSAHPMAAGRLKSDFPGVDPSRSLIDAAGNIVQPYGTYDVRDPAGVGEERRYHVELWPIGNQFDAGHRLRLHVLGVSGASMPGVPALNTVRLGEGGSRLLFPVLPGSELTSALAGADGGPEAAPPTSDEKADRATPRAVRSTATAMGGSLPRTGGTGSPLLPLLLLAALGPSWRVLHRRQRPVHRT